MAEKPVLACDLGGTWLRVAVVRPDGTVSDRQAIPTPSDDPDALARAMGQVLEEPGRAVAGAVVGVPGPVDYVKGEVLEMPNLPEWAGRISANSLSAELGLPTLLANDADLAALGEHRYGAGRGSQDMLYVTSSTGVGAGVILGSKLLRGRLSLAEVGHTIMCDHSTGETMESLGSGTALTRLAGEDAASVAGRAQAGDAEALRQFTLVAEGFAIGVFNLVHCFAPELVVVGGGMSQAGELLLEPVRRLLRQKGLTSLISRVRVVRAEGDDDVGLRGAAAFWADAQTDG